MRIALITETWLPTVDGVVTRLRHTVRRLAALGHDVLVLAPSAGPMITRTRQIELPGMVLPFVDRRRRVGLPLPSALTGPLQRFEPEVVHLVNPVLMGWAAHHAVARHYPTVVSFHTDLEAYVGRYHLRALHPPLRVMMRSTYGRADLALATSPSGQERLRAVGVDSELWPPAVDRDVFGPGSAPGTAPPWLTDRPDVPTVICVGRLAPEKNLDLLAPVLAAAPRSRTWQLTFIGDGPERRRLEARFAGLPVRFAGTRSATEVAAAYRWADVLLMPSVTETVGLVLLEAAACGTRIVAADTPAVRHTTEGIAAVLVPPTAGPDRWAVAVADALDRPRPAPAPVASWHEVTDGLIEAYRSVAGIRWRGRPRRVGSRVPERFEASAGRTARRSCVADS